MKHVSVFGAALILALGVGVTAADSPFLKEFKKNYGQLDIDLLNNPVELATVSNFTYEKDLARFTFIEGKVYLARYVMDRPTTAVFIGKGTCAIDIPNHTERINLWYASGDSSVRDTFSVCFIHMSDDLDLRLKEKFTFEKTSMPWKDYTVTKQSQGEFFFRPMLLHERDNIFQQLRSCYERSADGYFWADFNRYNFLFDPNRPEQTVVSYERAGGDIVMVDGAVLQRKERDIYDDRRLSEIAYSTALVSQNIDLKMAGLDGRSIERARADLNLVVMSDSLRFTSFYINHTLKDDSMYLDGKPVDYYRRIDFAFVGVMLPKYYHRGDTIHLSVLYHGRDYVQPFPFFENPHAAPIRVHFSVPKGYNFVMPGIDSIGQPQKGKVQFTAAPAEPYRLFYFQPYAGGFDTVTQTSASGLSVHFLRSKALNKTKYSCFLSDDLYQPPVIGAIDYFTSRLGAPPGAKDLFVYPEVSQGMPGLLCVPQVKCLVDGTGGICLEAGIQASRQYFGNLMQIASPREYWMVDAIPHYLGLMSLQQPLGAAVFYAELQAQRNAIYTLADQNKDQPLAAGERVPPTLRITKGSWVFHMLRYLMYDLDKSSDRTFLKFLNEFNQSANSAPMTNADFEKLAEKYYGQPLEWFFDEWVYSRNIPRFDVKSKIEQQGTQWVVNATVGIKDVLPSFTMPVICRVTFEDGRHSFMRQTVTGAGSIFTLGPFPDKPGEFVFNEFYSVLAHE